MCLLLRHQRWIRSNGPKMEWVMASKFLFPWQRWGVLTACAQLEPLGVLRVRIAPPAEGVQGVHAKDFKSLLMLWRGTQLETNGTSLCVPLRLCPLSNICTLVLLTLLALPLILWTH